MRLYVEELRAIPLVQVFTRETACTLVYVRLHLCKYLSPAGTFIVQLTDSDNNVIATSSQTLADMIASGSTALQGNYYHGHIRFAFDRAYDLRPGTYKIKLTSTGYTYADSTFMGWVKAVTDPAIGDTGAPADRAVECPYDFEIYAYTRVR